jgi:hypothetical protein
MPDSSPPPVPSPATTPAGALTPAMCPICGEPMRNLGYPDSYRPGCANEQCPTFVTPSAPPAPAPASELDELERLARALIEARAAYEAYIVAEGWTIAGFKAAVTRCQEACAAFTDEATPERVAQLVAAARRGMEDSFTADDVLDVHAVGAWDGGSVNRPKPGQERRAAIVVRRAMDARSAAARASRPPSGADDAR